jgi:hypothetical protein
MGMQEMNPLFPSLRQAVNAKLVFVPLATALISRLDRKHPRQARLLLVGANVVQATVVASNIRGIMRNPK